MNLLLSLFFLAISGIVVGTTYIFSHQIIDFVEQIEGSFDKIKEFFSSDI